MSKRLEALCAVLPLVIFSACGDAITQPMKAPPQEIHTPRMTVADFTGVPGYLGTSESGLPVVSEDPGSFTSARVEADVAMRGQILGSASYTKAAGIVFKGSWKATWTTMASGHADSLKRHIVPDITTTVSNGGTNALFVEDGVQPFDCRTAYGSLTVEGDFEGQNRWSFGPLLNVILAKAGGFPGGIIPDSLTFGNLVVKPVDPKTASCYPASARVILTKDTLQGLGDVAVASIDLGYQPCKANGTYFVTSPLSPVPVFVANQTQVTSQGYGVANVFYKCDAQGFKSKEWTIYPAIVTVKPPPEAPQDCDDNVTWDVVEQCPGSGGSGTGSTGGDPAPLGPSTTQSVGSSSSSEGFVCEGRPWYLAYQFDLQGASVTGYKYLGWFADSCWPI